MPNRPLSTRRFLAAVLTAVVFPSILPAEEPALLNIKDVAPGIVVEMRYATTDNFTGKVLYPAAECVLCEPAALRLAAVQKTLQKRGLGLKVWDCYRPVSVQWKLWETVPDARYVADPKKGSRHNRGASVDLTLVDAQGRELEMPTAFDEFSEKAHRTYDDLPAHVLRNRQILQDAMEAEGFVGLPTEWWHFDDPLWARFALRDEPLGSPSLKTDKAAPPLPAIIDAGVNQLLTVTSSRWDSPIGKLQRWQKKRESGHAWGTPGPSAWAKKAWPGGAASIRSNRPAAV